MIDPPHRPEPPDEAGISPVWQLATPVILFALSTGLGMLSAWPSILFFMSGIIASLVCAVRCFTKLEARFGCLLGLLGSVGLLAIYSSVGLAGCSYLVGSTK